MNQVRRGVPLAGYGRLRAGRWHESDGSFVTHHHSTQTMPEEHDRVVAILARGGNDVPPALVRRAIDERWSVDQAARAFHK